MRCHLAYARARAFQGLDDCPLYLRGVTVQRAGEHAIEIIGADPRTIEHIQQDARAIAP
jgi:hypothetical protein